MKSGKVFLFLQSLIFIVNVSFSNVQDDKRIWKEFISLLKDNKIPIEKILPHKELGDNFKPMLKSFLDTVRAQASEADWNSEPEIIHIENRIQYIIPWTAGSEKVTYCFSFVIENSEWYFQHLELIFIRLDKIGNFPVSKFPDISESKKNWAREELWWSFIISNCYLPKVKEAGKEAALNMLKDGGGYALTAKAWVPFVESSRAFILYLCWEQANLRGNEVTLIKLKEKEAEVKLNTYFFAVYFAAAHLKPVISLDDYTYIFETIWQDRANNAGWNLNIKYSSEYEATFHFTR